ncbi:unnamed protein product [Spirodela intermedia]|uniref:Uncharacterized protein n=1 Tax=Spirodela intermedia TaxID=51605 RepID=A0ABN7ED41_SPIIN|nr:unnamed protein product [Spirodela intermedia]
MGRQIVFGGCNLRSRKKVTLWLSGGCHSTEMSWMEEVATRLPADRPLPDNGLAFTLSTYFSASVFLCTIFDNENDVSHPPSLNLMSQLDSS